MIDIIDMHIDETLTTQEQAAQEMKKTRKHQKLKKILLQRANTNHVEGGEGSDGISKIHIRVTRPWQNKYELINFIMINLI